MNFYIIHIYLFILYFITTYAKHFSCKIIHTPIYPTTPILRLHSILILEKNNISMYAIDFSPHENITKFNVIFRLLLGKIIKGKIRIIDLSKNSLDENHSISFSEFEKIDPYLTSILRTWGSSFQLYNRNCRDFSKFVQTFYNIFYLL